MIKKIIVMGFSLICIVGNQITYADDIGIESLEDKEVIEEIDAITTAAEIDKEPSINSRAAVVIDRNTGDILFGKQENTRRPMASTTKIMTAVVVIEKANLSDTVEVSRKAAGTGGSRLGLKAGDKITVQDLLYGLMLCSGNDAAVALAEYVGGSVEGFAELMNQKAKELKLEDTHFVTPHGLDQEEHYTTALELANITNYALHNETFTRIVGTKQTTVSMNGQSKNLRNTNELLGNLEGVYGVKTGFTNGANRCLVTSIKRSDLDIICVVLGADTKKFRTQDSIKLIEYVYQHYQLMDMQQIIHQSEEWKEIKEQGIKVEKGKEDMVDLVLEDSTVQQKAIEKNKLKDITIEYNLLHVIEAPIKEGKIVGTMKVKHGENVIHSVNIITKRGIERKQIIHYMKQFLEEYVGV